MTATTEFSRYIQEIVPLAGHSETLIESEANNLHYQTVAELQQLFHFGLSALARTKTNAYGETEEIVTHLPLQCLLGTVISQQRINFHESAIFVVRESELQETVGEVCLTALALAVRERRLTHATKDLNPTNKIGFHQ